MAITLEPGTPCDHFALDCDNVAIVHVADAGFRRPYNLCAKCATRAAKQLRTYWERIPKCLMPYADPKTVNPDGSPKDACS